MGHLLFIQKLSGKYRGHDPVPPPLNTLLGRTFGLQTVTNFLVLRLPGVCPKQPGWASTERNIYLLTPILIISHPLSAFSSSYCDTWHPPCSIYVSDVFLHISVQVFFGLPLGLSPSTSYSIHSSVNHCLLFAAHAHTIAACFVVVLKLYRLILVSPQPFIWNSVF